MEGLHCAISNAVNSGLIRGVKIGSSDIILSHLFYADDVVITTKWNARDLDNIIRVLHVFYLASSLKINIHKSNIYAPELILKAFERYRATFFWGGSHDNKKIAWIKWSNVLSSFDPRGGLNIGNLKAFNLALLQKWRWRMHSCPNSFWVKIIKALHGKEGGFDVQGCNFNGFIAWIKIKIASLSTILKTGNGNRIGLRPISVTPRQGGSTVCNYMDIVTTQCRLLP
ncbi:hypothetical protein Tco_1492542 [Tanacetum coccineum]